MAGARDHVFDHAVEAHFLAVVRGIDLRHSIRVQLLDFFRHDHAAAAAEYADVATAALAQHVEHVLEEFHVPALVAADGDAVGVFLQRGGDDVLDRAVVAQVDDFAAVLLQQAPHDVDGGVVAVEQRGGGDETQRRLGRGLRLHCVLDLGSGAGHH